MNKKAVSIMIGYVLLIAGIIVVSAIVYVWLRSYVPRETIECPDGVSLFVENSICEFEGGNYNINISIKNNGRFDVDGYFIKATKSQEQEVATFDISEGLVGRSAQGGIVLFSGGALGPGESGREDLYSLEDPIFSIEITPIKYEVIEGKNRLVSCGDAKIKETINC